MTLAATTLRIDIDPQPEHFDRSRPCYEAGAIEAALCQDGIAASARAYVLFDHRPSHMLPAEPPGGRTPRRPRSSRRPAARKRRSGPRRRRRDHLTDADGHNDLIARIVGFLGTYDHGRTPPPTPAATQTIVRRAEARCPEDLALPLRKGLAGAAAKMAATKMIGHGWLQEVDANLRRNEPPWRETGDGRGYDARLTDAGPLAIGIEAVAARATTAGLGKAPETPEPKQSAPRAETQQAMPIAILQASSGATVLETVVATGWQAYSAQDAMSGTPGREARSGRGLGDGGRQATGQAGQTNRRRPDPRDGGNSRAGDGLATGSQYTRNQRDRRALPHRQPADLLQAEWHHRLPGTDGACPPGGQAPPCVASGLLPRGQSALARGERGQIAHPTW